MIGLLRGWLGWALGAVAAGVAVVAAVVTTGDFPRSDPEVPEAPAEVPPEAHPLGAARGQLHENYIIAQTESGMVIVDQHAAHERLVYEKLKRQMAENGGTAQALLIPEIVELSASDRDSLLDIAPNLVPLGLTIEAFGGTAVAVRETPAILGEVNATALVAAVGNAATFSKGSRSACVAGP